MAIKSKVKIYSLSKDANGLNLPLPAYEGELIEHFGKPFIKFPDGTAYPENLLEYSITLDVEAEESFFSKVKKNKTLNSIIIHFSKYSFDIKSYLKAIFMVLVLCLPFWYFGGLDWKSAPYPAMVVYIFLTFFQRNDK